MQIGRTGQSVPLLAYFFSPPGSAVYAEMGEMLATQGYEYVTETQLA